MRIRSIFRTGLVLLAVVLGRPVFAWDADGHLIVAAIAEPYLTQEAAAEVSELLGNATLIDVATWADDIKADRPETQPWHHMYPPEDLWRVWSKHAPEEGCVLTAAIQFAQVLMDQANPKDERAEALRWLVHLVGDMHAPMNIGRKEDRGGQDIWVEFQRRPVNLYNVWNNAFRDAKHEVWTDAVRRLEVKYTPKQARKWALGMNPSIWVTESYRLAREKAYQIPDSGVLEDDPGYVESAMEITDERLFQAGVRLASLLNRYIVEDGEFGLRQDMYD